MHHYPSLRGQRRLALLILVLLVIQLLAACELTPPGIDDADVVGQQPTARPTEPAAEPTELPTITPEATAMAQRPTATRAETATPAPEPGPGYPLLSTPKLEHGVVAHLYWTDKDRTLTLAGIAGFNWVRQQIHWKDTEGPKGTYGWDELDRIVAAAEAHNIKLLLSIVQSPSFARSDGQHGLPDDPKDLGDFVEALATRYKGRVQAYEIWNEQNLAIENAGRVLPEDAYHYAEILMETYRRIKAVDPNAFVLAGAPSSTETNDPNLAIGDLEYYRLMYTYKGGMVKNYFDAQAVHPGGALNPPDTMWPDKPGPGPEFQNSREFYFRRLEDVRRVMQEHGVGDHQVWITEYGWATANDTPGYEFGNRISFETQAQYIVDAMELTREQYPWVGVMFLWNLNFAILKAQEGVPLHEQGSYGILNADWSPRPSFNAIQGYLHSPDQ